MDKDLEKYKMKWEITSGLMNPYAGQPVVNLQTMSALIEPHDLNILKSVSPSKGILQNTVRMYIYALARELEDEGITFYSKENEQRLHDIVRRRTALKVT
jgi:hypothetical protein